MLRRDREREIKTDSIKHCKCKWEYVSQTDSIKIYFSFPTKCDVNLN